MVRTTAFRNCRSNSRQSESPRFTPSLLVQKYLKRCELALRPNLRRSAWFGGLAGPTSFRSRIRRRMSGSDYDTFLPGHSAEPIDEWSLCVFKACRNWPLAYTGRWFRSDERRIRLRIAYVEGEPLEPLSAIELDTMNDQINLDFGSWCTPILRSRGSLCLDAEHAVTRARELVEGWLLGEVKLASYSDATGWRGSKIIYGDVPDALEPVPVEIGDCGSVSVRTWRRRDWRSWNRIGDAWIACENARD